MISISIRQLTKRFGSVTALQRLDLTIGAGELFFLLGPSGCGKTTLLRSLAGFYIPEEGTVLFGDEDVTRLEPHRRNTGMMFQSYALWPHLSVAENVAFGLEERRVPRAEITRRLITEQGFTMTELDSVPGGVGLTAYLNEVYAEDYPGVIGRTGMPDRFMAALGRLTPKEKFPLVAIVVSEEGATYRPEFEWLGEKLRSLGHDVHVVEPSQVMQMGDGSYVPVDGAPRRVDILYRFFELFDLANVKGADGIFNAVEAGTLTLTPPAAWPARRSSSSRVTTTPTRAMPCACCPRVPPHMCSASSAWTVICPMPNAVNRSR